MSDKKEIVKKANKTTVPIIIIIIIMFALMLVTVLFLSNYIKREIHIERTTYLEAQTQTITDLVNATLDRYSEYSVICKKEIEASLETGVDINEYMTNKNTTMGIDGAHVMVVDSDCVWYGADGTQGRITAPEYYYTDTEDVLYYITQGVDADVESVVYRLRLENPIEVQTKTGETTIEFVIVAYYLDNLHEQIADAFPYECNRFIMNENGLMLYKNFELGILMPGSNILKKYEEVKFLYDDDCEEQKTFIENRELAVAEFAITEGDYQGNYFICTSPLDINNWSLVFVIPSDSLSAGAYVEKMFLVLSIIFIIFTIALCAAAILFMRNLSGIRTIKKEREANELLQQASLAKSTFLANMSHDIRTPINGIMGMTAIAKMEDNPEKTRECLDKIEGASTHLLSLVNDVLDMSSIESGKITITNKPVDIRTVIANCSSIIKGQIGERDLMVVEEFDGVTKPYVLADELHLRQVIINILSNSVKYTTDGGTIWCRMREVSADDKQVVLQFEIEDTGVGMKPEFLEHIWESFSQEEGGSRTKYKGTGLGMTITKTLVELMGGTIKVESTLNIGSTFTVEIPFEIADESEVKPVETEKKADEKAKSIEGVNVLLVEDNDLNLEIALALISNEGAHITTARDGLEAVEAFKSNEPGTFDIILMDVMMPHMNGLEATETIRGLDREDAKTIPIIAMTANAFDEDIKATKKAGMNAHLSKPINMKEVISTISDFCKGEEK